ELEPRDLVRTDPRRGLDRDAVVARPSGCRRTRVAVASEWCRAVLSWIRIPRAEIRDLTHPSESPTTRAAVVESHDRRGALARAERRVAALPVPGRVKARDAGGHTRRRRDARAGARGARRGRDRRRRRASRVSLRPKPSVPSGTKGLPTQREI